MKEMYSEDKWNVSLTLQKLLIWLIIIIMSLLLDDCSGLQVESLKITHMLAGWQYLYLVFVFYMFVSLILRSF